MDVLTLKRESLLDKCKEFLGALGFVWETDSPFSGYFYLPYKNPKIKAGFGFQIVPDSRSFIILSRTLVIEDLVKKPGRNFSTLDAWRFLGKESFCEKLRFNCLPLSRSPRQEKSRRKDRTDYTRRVHIDPRPLSEKFKQLKQLLNSISIDSCGFSPEKELVGEEFVLDPQKIGKEVLVR